MDYYDWEWKPYVTAVERRRKAEREIEKRKKQGHTVSPVIIEGRAIAKTFWGKSWCDNLERYSDFANRLPRGRSYVRNGSVVDLQITPRSIRALVSGSELYEVALTVAPVAKTRWKSICADCAGAIDSLVELLQGRFSKGVMERICRQNHGLFPSPGEIQLSCSCPDWAGMCKHVAAVLYGIGARFDHEPELLFRLREVDEKELIAKAGTGLPLGKQRLSAAKVLGGEDLSDMFGLDMAQSASLDGGPADVKQVKPKRARKTGAEKSSAGATEGKRKSSRRPKRQRPTRGSTKE